MKSLNIIKISKILLIFLYLSLSLEADNTLSIEKDDEKIRVFISETKKLLVTQNIREGFRPYLHPIYGSSGIGILTQYSPGHHKHQTGLYWGLTRVNGRDYFHNPGSKYWRKKSANVVKRADGRVEWSTNYEMLDDKGASMMTETQSWLMELTSDGNMTLDLEWKGHANAEITISKYNYGGLFLRMPWKRNIEAETFNSKGDQNQTGEGKSAYWVDIGMEISGVDDMGRIVILDHPSNDGFPNLWRIDGQFGVGPACARRDDLKIEQGKSKIFKHRLVVYSGKHDKAFVEKQWKNWKNHQKDQPH